MTVINTKLIHFAGNTVFNLFVKGVIPGGGEKVSTWPRGTKQFADSRVEWELGGTAVTSYIFGRLNKRISLNTFNKRISLNTQIGDDEFGEALKRRLSGVGIRLIAPSAGSTAVNVILVEADGTPHWHYYPGEKITWRYSLDEEGATWFYTSGYGEATSEELMEMCEVFKKVRSRGTRVAFDPGPWLSDSSFNQQIICLLAHVNCLIGTKSELSFISPTQSRAITEIVKGLLTLGPQQVVVKCGSQGAVVGEVDQVNLVKTREVEGVHAVGAGDTFNAVLLYRLGQGQALYDAVNDAVSIATDTVQYGIEKALTKLNKA